MANRGKRSLVLGFESEEGRAVMYRPISHADAFVTNYLPPAPQAVGNRIDDFMRENGKPVYALATG